VLMLLLLHMTCVCLTYGAFAYLKCVTSSPADYPHHFSRSARGPPRSHVDRPTAEVIEQYDLPRGRRHFFVCQSPDLWWRTRALWLP
jgi:hypothetical protein